MTDEAPVGTPYLRVVRGEPTTDELAALVAVLAVRATAQGDAPPPAIGSAWTDRSRLIRRPVAHGPGAWRASAWPS